MTCIKKIRNWFSLLERCKRYADKLNQIDHLLTRYENDYRTSMDPITKKMIGEIDEILN